MLPKLRSEGYKRRTPWRPGLKERDRYLGKQYVASGIRHVTRLMPTRKPNEAQCCVSLMDETPDDDPLTLMVILN